MAEKKQFHLICLGVYSILCLVWGARIGPLFSWDYLHYHLYVVQAWWQGRLPEELFAASAQSYLNPWPHLPFYLVYRLIDDSYLGTLVMALLHSLNLWALHFVICQLVSPDDLFRRVAVFVGVLLGALSPGFLLELGTSYADIVVSIPALFSLYLLLKKAKQQPCSGDWKGVYLAAGLAGISVGMKPSLLVFCLPLFVAQLVVVRQGAFSLAWRGLLFGFLGMGLTSLGHMLMLWRSFGNPVFPLFNGFFASPWFPAVNVVSDRFRPNDFLDFLWFPVRMADSALRVSFESMMVDIRPLWAIALSGCVLFFFLLRRNRFVINRMPTEERLFWVAVSLIFPVWIYTSGNIRYAIQSLMLLGPVISLLAVHLAKVQRHLSMFVLLLPATVQAALATNLNFPNWMDAQPPVWGTAWLSAKLPAPYDTKPAYYFSLQSQAYASLVDRFPASARFINLIGQNTLEPGGKVLSAVEQLAMEKGLPKRTLYKPLTTLKGRETEEGMIASQNALLSDYGYRVVPNECFSIRNDAPRIEIFSCAMEKAAPLSPEEVARREGIDQRMSYWEKECPNLFFPAGFQSIQATQNRRRFYLATDFQIIAMSDGRLIARDNFNDSRDLVELEDVQGNKVLLECPSKGGV